MRTKLASVLEPDLDLQIHAKGGIDRLIQALAGDWLQEVCAGGRYL